MGGGWVISRLTKKIQSEPPLVTDILILRNTYHESGGYGLRPTFRVEIRFGENQ